MSLFLGKAILTCVYGSMGIGSAVVAASPRLRQRVKEHLHAKKTSGGTGASATEKSDLALRSYAIALFLSALTVIGFTWRTWLIYAGAVFIVYLLLMTVAGTTARARRGQYLRAPGPIRELAGVTIIWIITIGGMALGFLTSQP